MVQSAVMPQPGAASPRSAGEALIMSTIDQVLSSSPSSIVRDSKMRRTRKQSPTKNSIDERS